MNPCPKNESSKKMDNIYVMTCGCKLKADERVRVKNRAYQCPNHTWGRFDYFIKKCPDCHDEFKTEHPSKIRCDECQKIKNRENNRRAKYKYYHGIDIDRVEEKQEAAINTWDCIHRQDCIDEAEKSGVGGKPLPCLDCKKYQRFANAI